MKGKVMTVQGPVSPQELGVTMAHEHLLADLSCWFQEPKGASSKARIYEPVRLDNLWWIKQNLFSNKDNLLLTDVRESTREVMEFKRFGGNSIVDVNNIGIGRDPISLRNISMETGLNIIMGSGYYTSISHPTDLSRKTEDEIAAEIIRDIEVGVGETGIPAGIIGEIGLSDIVQSPDEEKVLRAAIAAQKATGAPLTIHPSFKQRQCERIIEVLDEEGADFKRTILSHTELFFDESLEYTYMLAETGLYMDYDTFGLEGNWPGIGLFEPSDTQRVKAIEKLIQNGYLDQILLSQDVCMKVMRMAYGGYGYAHIMRDVLPLFRKEGISGDEIEVMLVENPKRILQFV